MGEKGNRLRPSKGVEKVLGYFKKIGQNGQIEETFNRLRERYRQLDPKEKETLYYLMNSELEVNKAEIVPLLNQLIETEPDSPKWAAELQKLRARLRSPRLAIFQQLVKSAGGIRFLLDFREDLINSRRQSDLDFAALDSDLAFLLEMLFQESFLYLEEITLDSPYRQIEIIKNRDMVHPMTSLEEMGKRLGKDRRCFALYHRLLPVEPIVFIELALTQGIVRNISQIVSPQQGPPKAEEPDTALFYSINNTQNGLAGLGLGKVLIVRVVDFLRADNKKIKTFATLSPMPGFWDRYLRPILEGDDEPFLLKQEDIAGLFPKKAKAKILKAAESTDDSVEGFCTALLRVLSGTQWIEAPELIRHLKGPMIKIAYRYLTKEKNLKGKPLNPVAGFHLGNGAMVNEKYINFLANTSEKGLKESCGIMVNYIYTPNWLTQIRQSFRWLEKLEIRGFFGK